VAAALARLLANHPELSSITWTVGERPGVLTGYQISDDGRGEIIDVCARIMGGHVARSCHYRDDDGHGIAQLVITYDGVPVHVYATYVLPDSRLTAADLRRVLTGRPLGTVAVIEGGDDQ
jgi:hypothetical protein